MDVPLTSFPRSNIDDEIRPLLINSDADECNENLCTVIKIVVDRLYTEGTEANYEYISQYALKLLKLNLFIKNVDLCMGKILSLLQMFIETESVSEEVKLEMVGFREFLCITVLVLLKIKNSAESSGNVQLQAIDTDGLFSLLDRFMFVGIVARLIACHIKSSEKDHTSFVFLKFTCDIMFEYLYHVEIVSDQAFQELTQTDLILTLIADLLSNENFNNYDINGDDFEDTDKLVAYEEFKLLLLINEQYLMKSYSKPGIKNKVFDGLLGENENGHSIISGFINLLVYHINREESHIVKILILKFFYMVFTTSHTTKLPYVNDLKIIVDIFIRELNDLDYSNDITNENKILIVTYLKVMYPLLMFSQLSELVQGYKVNEIISLLQDLVLNSPNDEQIPKLASKCLSISWLKKRQKKVYSIDSSSSTSSSTSLSNLSHSDSSDSVAASFTRVASMSTTSRNDYHKHTTSHNSNIITNNNNVFLANTNILDLPKEYLENKPLPPIKETTLQKKALAKKAPPPPPPQRIQRQTHTPQSTPPPPPPPRRRR